MISRIPIFVNVICFYGVIFWLGLLVTFYLLNLAFMTNPKYFTSLTGFFRQNRSFLYVFSTPSLHIFKCCFQRHVYNRFDLAMHRLGTIFVRLSLDNNFFVGFPVLLGQSYFFFLLSMKSSTSFDSVVSKASIIFLHEILMGQDSDA